MKYNLNKNNLKQSNLKCKKNEDFKNLFFLKLRITEETQ